MTEIDHYLRHTISRNGRKALKNGVDAWGDSCVKDTQDKILLIDVVLRAIPLSPSLHRVGQCRDEQHTHSDQPRSTGTLSGPRRPCSARAPNHKAERQQE